MNGHAKIVADAAMRTAYRDLPVDAVPGRRPERWVIVYVEEAYIHCAKHIPRLLKLPRERAWGSDDARRKGGDYFGASAEPRPWVPAPAPSAAPVPAPRRPSNAPTSPAVPLLPAPTD